MGRSNGQKAQQKRERNQKKAAGGAKQNSTLKTRDKALTIQCSQCLTPFMGTRSILEITDCDSGNSSRVVLNQHVESKHAKSTFEACFPDFTD